MVRLDMPATRLQTMIERCLQTYSMALQACVDACLHLAAGCRSDFHHDDPFRLTLLFKPKSIVEYPGDPFAI